MNKNNAAFEYDQVNIICPVYQPGTYDDEAEKYIIYNVSILEQPTGRAGPRASPGNSRAPPINPRGAPSVRNSR